MNNWKINKQLHKKIDKNNNWTLFFLVIWNKNTLMELFMTIKLETTGIPVKNRGRYYNFSDLSKNMSTVLLTFGGAVCEQILAAGVSTL